MKTPIYIIIYVYDYAYAYDYVVEIPRIFQRIFRRIFRGTRKIQHIFADNEINFSGILILKRAFF